MKWHLFKIQGPILTDFLILEQVTIFFSVEKKHVKNNIQNAARYHKLYDVYLSTQKKNVYINLSAKVAFVHIYIYTHIGSYMYMVNMVTFLFANLNQCLKLKILTFYNFFLI